MSRRYKYNKKSGALQDGPPQSRTDPRRQRAPAAAPPMPQQAMAVAGHLAPASPGRTLDPHRNSGGSSPFFYTVEDGQRVLAVSRTGSMEIVEGPRRVSRFGNTFRTMQHYVAHPGSFLIVRYRDGRQEHFPGPAHRWFDPRVHLSIEKEESVQLTAEEAVVVYTEEDSEVSRRIVYGPTSFVPDPGEWLHTFSWHGSVGGQKVPNALVFQKLWQLPDQMYHDVEEVRTADDAVITVRLMIFFRLLDIDKLLATSHDPIGDFVNAATSDVIEYVRRFSFDEFKQKSDQLNRLQTYAQLTGRAEQCGYKIDNVVYRGYGAPAALQQMHEKATESRTRLQLEKATEQQAQELEDLKLERTMARAAREREAEQSSFTHRADLERRKLAEDLDAETARRDGKRRMELLDAREKLALATDDDSRRRTHLASLKELGVDLTAYLTADRPDRVIELRGAQAGHLHLKDS
jgi:hypothetical protein